MKYNKHLHLFAVLTAVSTFILIIVGGLVTSTNSGLAVPDWPQTYGYFMFSYPLEKMVGGIMYEHGHRIIASAVGALMVILALWMWKVEKRKQVRNLALWGVALVIVQGVFGGVTVLLFLPTWTSTIHATLAQSFFCVTVALALLTSKKWFETKPAEPREEHRTLRQLSVLTTLAVFIQLVIGAWMRHSEAGLAIPDFPLVYGKLFPSFDDASIVAYNKIRAALNYPAVNASQLAIHYLHRIGALVVSIILLLTSFRYLKVKKIEKNFSHPALALIFLLIIQVSLGILTVLSGRDFIIATMHQSSGALLLAVSFILAFRTIAFLPEPLPVTRHAPHTTAIS